MNSFSNKKWENEIATGWSITHHASCTNHHACITIKPPCIFQQICDLQNKINNGKANYCFVLLRFFFSVNPFHAYGLLLHPLKTSEKLWFSGGVESAQSHEMGYAKVWNVICLPSEWQVKIKFNSILTLVNSSFLSFRKIELKIEIGLIAVIL